MGIPSFVDFVEGVTQRKYRDVFQNDPNRVDHLWDIYHTLFPMDVLLRQRPLFVVCLN